LDKYKKLISNTLIFAIGTFSSKLLVFLLMPLYTRVLTDAQYGVVDLLMQTGNLLLPLVSLGINNAIIRFGLDKECDDRDVFTGGLTTLASGYVIFLIAYPLLRWALSFAGSAEITNNIGLIYLFVLLSTTRSLFASFVRSQERTRLFALDGVLSTAYTIGFNILFLVVFKWGITGYMMAVVCADALSSIFLFITGKLHRFINFKRLRWSNLSPMLRYCIPMIPTTVFWWITNVSDRFIVTAMLGEGANGLYAASYKIPTVLTLVSGIFIDAWQMSAISEARSQERAKFFTNVFKSYQALIFFAASGLILFAKFITYFMVSPAFYPSWQYVPFLIMATGFSCMVSFSGSVYMVEKKSVLILLTTLVGAAINVVLNFLLIPRYGVNGAAFATFVSYAVVFALRAGNTRRYIPVNWGVARLAINTAILMAQSLVLILEPLWWIPAEIILCAGLVAYNFKGLLETAQRILGKFLKKKSV